MLTHASLTVTLLVTLGMASTPTPSGSPQSKAAAVAADDGAVRNLVTQYADAREKNDAAAVAALFTADADQLVSSGEWRRGRDALVKGVLASSQAGGKRTITVETVRFLTADTAIVDGRYEITGGAAGDRRMWSSFVMTRTREGWRIAAIRNMLPAPAQ